MKKNKYKIIVFTLVLIIIALRVFIEPFRSCGDCMEPAVMTGQLCFLNKLSPYLCQYHIDDIIAFKYEGISWYSRIVALENDTIQIADGSVIVNGITFDDAKIHRNWSGWKLGTYGIDKPFQVPLGHVFVLSDNLSADHDDSRVFGPIPYSSILGQIWCWN